ncbi:MAG TPA: GNAT family N-acetyltransferase [Streptosporangiaceae bacterium]|nr:GNAT family N-acetyltransferase [Streptosporangiaceae bacterium]
MAAAISSGTVEVRRLVAADWAALREVRLTALADAPYAFSSTLDRELGFDEATWRGRLESTAHVGAWGPGPQPGLIGLAGGFPEAPEELRGHAPGPDEPAAWHLVSMWVSPQGRGQGIADRLVAAICELARADGAEQVALWVTEVNPRALAFYRRMGFRETGQRQLVWPDEPGHWEERMVRELR